MLVVIKPTSAELGLGLDESGLNLVRRGPKLDNFGQSLVEVVPS